MKSRIQLLTIAAVAMSLIPCGSAFAGDDVKSLFLEQAQKPSKPINTGVKYWIELERGGKKSKVSHRTAFKSNDRIRFHVIPNIDGYAYIVMMQGTKGDKAVLFPDSDKQVTENKIHANKEIVLPTSGANLKFDDKPGLETLRLVFSRTAIDPKTYLKPSGTAGGSVMLAAKPGTKSFVPPEVKVEIVAADEESTGEAETKNLTLERAADDSDGGEVTVISSNTTRPLSVDVALLHQ